MMVQLQIFQDAPPLSLVFIGGDQVLCFQVLEFEQALLGGLGSGRSHGRNGVRGLDFNDLMGHPTL